LREKLAEMMLKYTEQHPDIIRLKAAIDKLEADLPAKPGSKNPLSPSGGSISSAEETVIGNMYTRQRVELKQAIKALEGDIAKIKGEIAVYQARVEEAPTLSQEILILQRDYDNMRQSYHSLLNRRLEAEIAANMEKKQKGEQFIIIDEARMPKLPVSPKMPKLFLATVAGGFFLGGVLVFLIETIDLSVRRIDMLESEIGLPVLTMVPQIFTSKERRRHRMAMAATTLSILVAIALTGAFAMLVFLGFEPTLELIGYYLEA
jgi:hypothetical protein